MPTLASHHVGWQYQYVDHSSGVGVLDKAVRVLDALEGNPLPLAELTERSGLPRATAHRLAVALEVHRLVSRDAAGRFLLGPRLAPVGDTLVAAAGPVLAQLRDTTGESAQLYVVRGSDRVCVAAADRASGLRDTVPVGTVLPMSAGSAAHVLLAWLRAADGSSGTARLVEVRRRGWAQSVEEREPGLASVSAPVRAGEAVVAAVSISGPVERLSRSPGKRHGAAVVAAADQLSTALSG